MVFFSKFFSKTKWKGHIITDEDRKIALQTRIEMAQQKRELQKMQYEVEKIKLENYKKKLTKGDPIENILMSLILPKITNQANSSEQLGYVETVVSPPISQHIPNEQLELMWQSTPDTIKIASKTMSDEQLKSLIKKNIPSFDDETIERALIIARGR